MNRKNHILLIFFAFFLRKSYIQKVNKLIEEGKIRFDVNTSNNWETARKRCADHNAQLAVLNDSRATEDVRKFINTCT